MKVIRRLIWLPVGLLHAALVMYSHRAHWARKLRDGAAYAAAVLLLAALLVYGVGVVGAVPY